jgi:DNA-binding transcriptional LysR family regulator
MHHELEKFLAVVEHGSFTEAARLAHVSQPALTAAVQSLEARYQVSLLVRNTRPLQLTDAGRAVYDSANRIRLEVAHLAGRLEDMSAGRGRIPLIGAIDSIAMLLLRQEGYVEHYSIQVDNSYRLLEDVRLSRIDIAFITKPLTSPKDGLKLRRLMDEPFTLVARPAAAEASEQRLLNQRRIDNLITYNPESTTFKRILADARRQGIHLHTGFVSTSPELIRQAVRQGKGVGLLPHALVAEDIQRGDLLAVRGFTFKRPVVFAYRSDAQLNPEHHRLIDALKTASNPG